jgi:hypothetical protein
MFQPVLAQSQSGSSATQRAVVLALVLIVLVLVSGIGLMMLRRMLKPDDEKPGDGMMLDDLRRLRDQGKLSSDEFQRAVESIAGRVSGPESGPDNKNARL